MNKYNVMDYANGCGIGSLTNLGEVGISLMFETQENMNNFPYKEDSYEGVPIYKRIIGTIKVL